MGVEEDRKVSSAQHRFQRKGGLRPPEGMLRSPPLNLTVGLSTQTQII